MHLCMQRDIWLDNVKNLRRYILRYTVGNPTSSRNVASHWFYAAHSTCRFVQIVHFLNGKNE